jgi:hypothetical protein
MPRIGAPTEDLKAVVFPEGDYDVRLEGFQPAFSKDKQSVNLNPQMVYVGTGDPKMDGKKAFDSLNTKAPWRFDELCRCFGERVVVEGDQTYLPGDFVGPENEPSKWQYTGPLLGKVGKVHIIKETYNNKEQNKITGFIPAPGFEEPTVK